MSLCNYKGFLHCRNICFFLFSLILCECLAISFSFFYLNSVTIQSVAAVLPVILTSELLNVFFDFHMDAFVGYNQLQCDKKANFFSKSLRSLLTPFPRGPACIFSIEITFPELM